MPRKLHTRGCPSSSTLTPADSARVLPPLNVATSRSHLGSAGYNSTAATTAQCGHLVPLVKNDDAGIWQPT